MEDKTCRIMTKFTKKNKMVSFFKRKDISLKESHRKVRNCSQNSLSNGMVESKKIEKISTLLKSKYEKIIYMKLELQDLYIKISDQQ